MRRSRTVRVQGAGLLTGVIVLAGCTGQDGPGSSDAASPGQTATSGSAATTGPMAGDAGAGPLPTAESAVEAALAIVPGGAALEAGQTDEAGREVWYVLVRDADGTGTELYLARDNGELVQRQAEPVPTAAQAGLPVLTAQQGMAAALAAVPGSVVEFDLGTEQGATVWAVLVSSEGGGFEVYVDAATGVIRKQERQD